MEGKKQIGAYNLVHVYEGLEAFSLRLMINVLGMTPTETGLLLEDVRNELLNTKTHSLYDL